MKPSVKYPLITACLLLLVEAVFLILFFPSLIGKPKTEALPAPRAKTAFLQSIGRYTSNTDYPLTGTLHATEEAEKALSSARYRHIYTGAGIGDPYRVPEGREAALPHAEGPFLLQIKQRAEHSINAYTVFTAEIVYDYTESGREGETLEIAIYGTSEATLFPLPACGDLIVTLLDMEFLGNTCGIPYDETSIAKVLRCDGNLYAAEVYAFYASDEDQPLSTDELDAVRKELRIDEKTPLYSLRDYEDMLLEKRAAYDADPFVYEHFFDLQKAHLPSEADVLSLTEGMSCAEVLSRLGKPHDCRKYTWVYIFDTLSSTTIPVENILYPDFSTQHPYCHFIWHTEEGETYTVTLEVPSLDSDVPDAYASYEGMYAPIKRFASELERIYVTGRVLSVTAGSVTDTGGASSPDDESSARAITDFDIDGDGETESCAITVRGTEEKPLLYAVARSVKQSTIR